MTNDEKIGPTELRDRLIFLIRRYRPDVLFLPNPYVHNDPEFDHYHAGSAAGPANFQPPYQEAGLQPYRPAEAHYSSLPFDPQDRRYLRPHGPQTRGAAGAGHVQPRGRARPGQPAARTGRRLPLLEGNEDTAADRLLETRVRELARQAADGSGMTVAENFLVAGSERRP